MAKKEKGKDDLGSSEEEDIPEENINTLALQRGES
jgi:hypothetical protein